RDERCCQARQDRSRGRTGRHRSLRGVGECGRIAVFLRAEPAHQFVPAIYDAAEKVALREVRCSISEPHLSYFSGLATCVFGKLQAHIAELLQRACEAPVRIQHIERIPTNERSIAGHVDAATRPGFGGIGDYAFETAPLEVWIAFPDLFFAKACEGQERRREVQMRAYGRGALPLRSTRRTNGQIDDASFVERDSTLLCHAVGAVHFAVVPRENHHGVLPKIQAVECFYDLREVHVDQAHAVDELVPVFEPEVHSVIRYAPRIKIKMPFVMAHTAGADPRNRQQHWRALRYPTFSQTSQPAA